MIRFERRLKHKSMTIWLLSIKMTQYEMDHLEALIFLTTCEFFQLEVAEKTLIKKPGHTVRFQFSIKEMRIKMARSEYLSA